MRPESSNTRGLVLHVFLAIAIAAWCAPAQAQDPKPWTVKSDNGAFELSVTPGAEGCSATLTQGGKDVWTTKLVNDVAPELALVSGTGKHVVTIDEWRKAGTHPVVIYGKKGKVEREHTLASLGLSEDDLSKVKRSQTSTWWARDAMVFFNPKGDHLIIYLRFGKLIVIALKDGKVAAGKNAKKAIDYGRKEVAARAMGQLSAEKPQERRVAAEIVGQLGVAEAIPDLQTLLADDTNYRSGGKKVYYVRKAAKEALEALGETVDEGIVIEE